MKAGSDRADLQSRYSPWSRSSSGGGAAGRTIRSPGRLRVCRHRRLVVRGLALELVPPVFAVLDPHSAAQRNGLLVQERLPLPSAVDRGFALISAPMLAAGRGSPPQALLQLGRDLPEGYAGGEHRGADQRDDPGRKACERKLVRIRFFRRRGAMDTLGLLCQLLLKLGLRGRRRGRTRGAPAWG